MTEGNAAELTATQSESVDAERLPEVWIFQANPKLYDISAALGELSVLDWQVNQSRHQIHAGHTVYVWQSGADAGILARGEVLTEPEPISAPRDVFWDQPADHDEEKPRVWLRIDRVLDEPLLRTELMAIEATADLLIIRQANATNFGVNDRQAAALRQLFDDRPGREVEPEKLFYFTASGKLAAHRAQISLVEGIPLTTLAPIVELDSQFERHAKNERVFAWGARAGLAAEQKWMLDELVARFTVLDPYSGQGHPKSILEIEEENYDPETGRQRQIYCLTIASKRYGLFIRRADGTPWSSPAATRRSAQSTVSDTSYHQTLPTPRSATEPGSTTDGSTSSIANSATSTTPSPHGSAHPRSAA